MEGHVYMVLLGCVMHQVNTRCLTLHQKTPSPWATISSGMWMHSSPPATQPYYQMAATLMQHLFPWQTHMYATNKLCRGLGSGPDQFGCHLPAPHPLFSSVLPSNSLWSTRVQVWISKATSAAHHRSYGKHQEETAASSQRLSGQCLQSDAAVCMQKCGHAVLHF